MKVFVQSRLALCLSNLGFKVPKFKNNPIGDWFYKDINMVKFSDFFTGLDASYNRDWSEQRFTWRLPNERD